MRYGRDVIASVPMKKWSTSGIASLASMRRFAAAHTTEANAVRAGERKPAAKEKYPRLLPEILSGRDDGGGLARPGLI